MMYLNLQTKQLKYNDGVLWYRLQPWIHLNINDSIFSADIHYVLNFFQLFYHLYQDHIHLQIISFVFCHVFYFWNHYLSMLYVIVFGRIISFINFFNYSFCVESPVALFKNHYHPMQNLFSLHVHYYYYQLQQHHLIIHHFFVLSILFLHHLINIPLVLIVLLPNQIFLVIENLHVILFFL